MALLKMAACTDNSNMYVSHFPSEFPIRTHIVALENQTGAYFFLFSYAFLLGEKTHFYRPIRKLGAHLLR